MYFVAYVSKVKLQVESGLIDVHIFFYEWYRKPFYRVMVVWHDSRSAWHVRIPCVFWSERQSESHIVCSGMYIYKVSIITTDECLYTFLHSKYLLRFLLFPVFYLVKLANVLIPSEEITLFTASSFRK